jgi:hypothetical protein
MKGGEQMKGKPNASAMRAGSVKASLDKKLQQAMLKDSKQTQMPKKKK